MRLIWHCGQQFSFLSIYSSSRQDRLEAHRSGAYKASQNTHPLRVQNKRQIPCGSPKLPMHSKYRPALWPPKILRQTRAFFFEFIFSRIQSRFLSKYWRLLPNPLHLKI
jgi:hypothetical protein